MGVVSLAVLLFLITQSVIASNETTVPPPPPPSHPPLCRERKQNLPPSTFRLTTCATCYFYLFTVDDQTKDLWPDAEWLVGPNDTRVLADVRSDASRSFVCSTLSADECVRWKTCCLAAEDCCRRQLEVLHSLDRRRLPSPGGDGDGGSGGTPSFCPQQWDGFGCWDFTAPGHVASDSCPEFIKYSVSSEKSYKECTTNGTWFEHPISQLEWTDYSNCISVENLMRGTITSIVCNVISLVGLIPSVIIFTCYRPLRIQNRVVLHINLFASFILYAVVTLLWDTLIVLNRIEHDSESTYIDQNTNACKFLYVLTRYSRMTNFLWMFCEAVFLHRLLVKAFQPPKNLIIFYVTGWIFPWIPVIIYIVLRLLFANTSCWIKPFGNWEWLIYVPNLLALLLNFVVLLDILRILVTQVQSHANELNSYRRALKATFILVPLFGLQLFLVIYRPPNHSPIGRHYEMIAAFIVNLQGLFVALIFCLINGEVSSHLRRSCQKFRAKLRRRDYQKTLSLSMATTNSELMSTTTTREGGWKNSGSNGNTTSTGNYHLSTTTTTTNPKIQYERCGDVVVVSNDDDDDAGCLATDDFVMETKSNGQLPWLKEQEERRTENRWRLG